MKFLSKLLAAVAMALCLCGGALASNVSPAESIDDVGTIAVPGKPGFKLHGYRLNRGVLAGSHYVYVLEFDGKPYAGTGTSYKAGKTPMTNEVVMQGAPGGISLKCNSVDECEKALSQAREQEALDSLRSCPSIAECEKRLQAIKNSTRASR